MPTLTTATVTSFPGATGAVTRPLSARLAEVINVKDFNAAGNGATDDTTAIQNAFNAAFGTAGAPHGTNATLNKPVYFPAGMYQCNSLTLTRVLGGRIFGDGPDVSVLRLNGPGANILRTDGLQDCFIEGLGFDGNGQAGNGLVLDLQAGGVAVGLSNNTFVRCLFTHCATNCVLIQPTTAAGGNANCFIGCEFIPTGTGTGLKVNAATAVGNLINQCTSIGTAASSGIGVWVAAGGISAITDVTVADPIGVGIQIDAGNTVVAGGRSEISTAGQSFKVTGGSLSVVGFSIANPGQIGVVNSPGRLYLDCFDVVSDPSPISGNGILQLRNINNFTANFLSSFTGILTHWLVPTTTFASLPTGYNGMEANITDGDATITFGHVEAGGGLLYKRLRYRSGTGWTVMGV